MASRLPGTKKPVSKPRDPFYLQVTPVKTPYKDSYGVDQSIDLPLVTLPPGTVLFRGLKIPHPDKGDDVRYFYRDYLGDPEPDGRMCLSPVHNVFFYPFPFVAFGAHDIGETFQSMQIVVLIQPITFICAVSPSQLVRGSPRGLTGTSPWKRCSSFEYECHTPTLQEQEAKEFDNCIDPAFQQSSGVRGWMAVADLDSFMPKKLLKKGMEAKNVPMSKYIRHLEEVFPGKGSELLAHAYTDLHRHYGFPELAIYPYRRHPGPKRIVNGVKSSKKAIQLIEKEINSNNLNFLPLAAFTKDATIDMVNGRFTYEALGIAENSFSTPPIQHQLPIEIRMNEYLDLLQTTGLDLPFYGKGKLSFDSRTGFYVFPQIIPRSYRLPTPDDKKGSSYSSIVMPLDTPEAKKQALTYMLLFRTPIPEKFMQKYGLEKGVAVRRAMVFGRPPVLSKVFEALDLAVPPAFKASLARAAKQYQLNTGVPSKTQQAKTAAAAAAAAASEAAIESGDAGGAVIPSASFVPLPGQNVMARTPPYGPMGATPPYGPPGMTPPYGAATPPGTPPSYTPPGPMESPPFGAPGMTPPFRGGNRSTRSSKAKKSQSTRKVSRKPFLHFATEFKSVWKSLATHLKHSSS